MGYIMSLCPIHSFHVSSLMFARSPCLPTHIYDLYLCTHMLADTHLFNILMCLCVNVCPYLFVYPRARIYTSAVRCLTAHIFIRTRTYEYVCSLVTETYAHLINVHLFLSPVFTYSYVRCSTHPSMHTHRIFI